MARQRNGAISVLVAGGGVAALEAALALRALAEERVRVELIAPEPRFWYRPVSVAEPFELGKVRHFGLSELAAAAGAAAFSLGKLVSVDPVKQVAETAPGGLIAYDRLIIACGAVPQAAVIGAITFRGSIDTDKITRLLTELEAGSVRSVAFVIPPGRVWNLPAYELALMMEAWLAARGVTDTELTVVTPEPEPLHLFGTDASRAVRELLEDRDIRVHCGAHATAFRDGELVLTTKRTLPTERAVAIPRLVGQQIGGIPRIVEGFIPIDEHCRVPDVPNVFAAGDITSFPVKQGGIAAQQGETVAQAIAAEVGAELTPQPFRPVLRGLLLTGHEPRYLRRQLTSTGEDVSLSRINPLWWPPAKVVGHYLAPFLGALAGTEAPIDPEPPPKAIPVNIELDDGYGGGADA
jgi:sulfide:quinone oxidoreductase